MSSAQTAGIIGGGVIGGGWAARLLLHGWDVRIFDPDPEAQRKITAVLDNARRTLPGLSDVALPREGALTFCATIGDAAQGVPLIVESVPERLDVKRAVYTAIEAVNTGGVIASSTSGILPSELQAKMDCPERLIVAHPFNPVYLLPLVELVAGKATATKHIAWAQELYTELGMKPLVCRVEIEGFLSDRLQEALWREALWLLSDGVATAAEIDAAIAYGPGLRWAQMGTMQTFHLAGGEGGMRAMLAMFGPCLKWPWTRLTEVPDLTDDLVETVGAQCDAQAGNLSPGDLEKIRDDNLVAILRALKAQNWGAGSVLKHHDDRLLNTRNTEIDLTLPIRSAHRVVPTDWLDFNGHMNEARYLQAFSEATDRFMAFVGCDAAYIAKGGSYFTAETHICHVDEVAAGASIYVDTLCLSGSGKTMHIVNSMFAQNGRLLATCEQVLIHVSLKTRRPSPPAGHIAEKLAAIAAHHARLPRPAQTGRFVGASRS